MFISYSEHQLKIQMTSDVTLLKMFLFGLETEQQTQQGLFISEFQPNTRRLVLPYRLPKTHS